MIDHAKLARLGFDLEQRRAALSGVDGLRHETREHIGQLELTMLTREFVGMTAAGLDSVQIDRETARHAHPRGAHEARRAHDLDVARRVIALRVRLAELQRRSAAMADDLNPLVQLVQRCRAYAAGN